jgi:hypothetical protein
VYVAIVVWFLMEEARYEGAGVIHEILCGSDRLNLESAVGKIWQKTEEGVRNHGRGAHPHPPNYAIYPQEWPLLLTICEVLAKAF